MHADASAPVAITMGDINGVGPEILARAFARPGFAREIRPIVIGCPRAYAEARVLFPDALPAITVKSPPEAAAALEHGVPFLSDVFPAPPRHPGVLDPEAGRAAMEWLSRAVALAVAGEVCGIVTCPINKEGIHLAGYACRGHTDFIAQRTGAPGYRMSLVVRDLLVVHISDHVSLRSALDEVRTDRIAESIRLADDTLARLGKTSRRIAVAGLNPHAGEAGAFGTEEREEIAPAVERCRAEGIDCSGPHSPDAVFRQAIEGAYDAVIAMYHDQGHIPMKLAGLDEGINITLGIPIVRTSVDHGTAYDIAGKGTAREDSLVAACRLAARLGRAAARSA
jgi:4-hydroxythreonine-4-phosphate dehydrogenase